MGFSISALSAELGPAPASSTAEDPAGLSLSWTDAERVGFVRVEPAIVVCDTIV
jgi:hypothetical protein